MGAGRVNAEGQINDHLFSMEGFNTCSWERVLSWQSSRGYKGAVVRNYRHEPSTPEIQGRESLHAELYGQKGDVANGT